MPCSGLERSSDSTQAEAGPGPSHRQFTETTRGQECLNISAEGNRDHRKRKASEGNLPGAKKWSGPSH